MARASDRQSRSWGPARGGVVGMAMVQVGEVRVRVQERLVSMDMRMRLTSIPARGVRVLMVLVMPVRMRVLDRIMAMQVGIPFGQHQRTGDRHRAAHGLQRRLAV